MAWMHMLCQTYDNNKSKAGEIGDSKAPLSRLAHISAKAQITITLRADGTFVNACEVPKEKSQTFIPVTEKSAGRSGNIAPHPLADTLSYLAGDYEKYAATQKEAAKAHSRFEAYQKQLSAWCTSEYTHPKARAILAYTETCNTIYDLIQSGLIQLGEDGKFAKAKIQGTPYEKCMVRYRVVGLDEDNSSASWEDKSLSDSFVAYYLSNQPGEKDICYGSGKMATACINHPKGILAASYNAKLISANDKTGFTYRGRFDDANEACTIGYDTTQKAHNALTWLAKNQGVNFGGRTYLCWNPVGKKIPNPAFDFGAEIEGDTAEHFQKKLYKAFLGYADMLDENDDIVFLALDAATTGRLSITCYSELKSSVFLQNYRAWCESVRWYIPDFTPEHKYTECVRTLKTRQIIEYAFGDEQNGKITVGDKLLKEHSQRIISCMIHNHPFPRDIAHALAIKASNPVVYTGINGKRVLAYACAAIAKCHNDNQKEVKYAMNLDYENNDRSYLFGRLLAIADKVEQSAMYLAYQNESRETNAMRLRSAFANHPMRTWRTLEEALNPYYAKLRPQTRSFYRQIVRDLLCKIEVACTVSGELDKERLNKRLDDVYLIGYSNQFNELAKSKDHEMEEEEL